MRVPSDDGRKGLMYSFRRFVLSVLAVVTVAGVGMLGADKAQMVQGKVTAVSNDSLAIMHGADTMTFTVDASTKVIGTGVSTLMREKKAKHETFVLTDGVGKDDMVKVTYHDMGGGTLHAATINVVQKSLAK